MLLRFYNIHIRQNFTLQNHIPQIEPESEFLKCTITQKTMLYIQVKKKVSLDFPKNFKNRVKEH